MALPALKQAMDEFVAFPPAFRFDEAMSLVQTVHDLDALIEAKGNEFAAWRVKMVRATREGFGKIEAATGDLPESVYAPMLVNLIDEALAAARGSLPTFAGSFADRPDTAQMLDKVSRKSVEGARYIRKQIRRIDELRSKQLDTYLLIISALREMRSRYELHVGDGPTGSNVSAYLNSLNDRYSVVNAKLAQ